MANNCLETTPQTLPADEALLVYTEEWNDRYPYHFKSPLPMYITPSR
jgi:hypothetical protein